MKAIHYIKVARHFWPWERAFFLALFHDSIEDGWRNFWLIRTLYPLKRWTRHFLADLLVLSRFDNETTYADYILAIKAHGGDVQRVKEADLIENYKRAPKSLRKRYAKALMALA